MSKVVVLTGLPGCGKSTIATKWFPTYTRINQDILGTRQACIEAMKRALEQGKDVIIDRTNVTKAQRAFWVDLALGYGAESIVSIFIHVNEEECIARILERRNHPTIPYGTTLDKARDIVYSFAKTFEHPLLEEGFSSIVITRN